METNQKSGSIPQYCSYKTIGNDLKKNYQNNQKLKEKGKKGVQINT